MYSTLNIAKTTIVIAIIIIIVGVAKYGYTADKTTVLSTTRPANVLEANALRIVDDKGKERAYIGLDKDGTVMLTLSCESHKSLMMAVKNDGRANINLISSNGKAEALLSSGLSNISDMSLLLTYYEYGTKCMSAHGLGGLGIKLFEKQGAKRYDLRLSPEREMSMSMFDKDGKPIPLAK